MKEPEEHPFGKIEYTHYDPAKINTLQDVIDALNWIAEENEKRDMHIAADSFSSTADMIETCLIRTHSCNTSEWHPVKDAAYDVNHLYETVESETAKEHIKDAVLSLQSALEAERSDE